MSAPVVWVQVYLTPKYKYFPFKALLDSHVSYFCGRIDPWVGVLLNVCFSRENFIKLSLFQLILHQGTLWEFLPINSLKCLRETAKVVVALCLFRVIARWDLFWPKDNCYFIPAHSSILGSGTKAIPMLISKTCYLLSVNFCCPSCVLNLMIFYGGTNLHIVYV